MQIDFPVHLLPLSEISPGTFFVGQTAEEAIFGMAAFMGSEQAAVLFSFAPGRSNPFPCVVTQRYFSDGLLGSLEDAYISPDLSISSLVPSFASPNGPGSILVAADGSYMRIARAREGYRYAKLQTGEIFNNPPHGQVLNVNRWSISRQLRSGDSINIFEFSGPVEIP